MLHKKDLLIYIFLPGEESCYKSVDTKRGPQLVLSVSRTFIKLKDLIVEKKSLQKEIDTLKALNIKLESKVKANFVYIQLSLTLIERNFQPTLYAFF